MKFYKSCPAIIIGIPFTVSLLLFSCNSDSSTNNPIAIESQQTGNNSSDSARSDHANTPVVQAPQINIENIEVKTYEVKDNEGKSQGWGYDIYINDKKLIHQPIIPAIPGNNPFKTEKDALKTGLLAVDKMKKSGSLPTLSVKELDSLGITR